ncbi:hypothetical protein AB0I72_19175 [Nocardiopsis sp. NPDC049922]|uniref:hypothetical protein n=1 Tax=Nocardiopsis sp. NPDC049922 TaxID=3155157 RepID=UPI0033E3DA7D
MARRSDRPPLDVEIQLGREVARVAAQLRQIDAKLPTKLRSELRKAAKVGVQRVKREAKGLPSAGKRGGTAKHPHKPKQLRRTVARGVRARASTKMGMRIITAMPDAEQSVIPRGLDSRTRHRDGGWRHPIFPRKGTDRADWRWVDQKGGSWFMEPLGEMQPEVQANLRKVLDDAAAQVAAAGG